MAIQSAYSSNGNASSGTVTAASAQTAGNTNVVHFFAASFGSLGPFSVTDTKGNSYIQVNYSNGGTGGFPSGLTYVATGIATASAGANVITVSLGLGSYDADFLIFFAEEPAAASVRVANYNSAGFSGLTATVSLAGTTTGDVVCAAMYSYGASGAGTSGNIGTNTATSLQSYVADGAILEDGASSGGTINVTATATGSGWVIVAIALVPPTIVTNIVNPTDAIFFGIT